MRIRLLAAVLGVATALAGAQTAAATDDHEGAPPPDVSAETPCLVVDLRQGEPDNPACDDLPHFKAGFLNRVWRFNGAVDGLENGQDHSLSMTLDSIDRLPKRFRNQDDELLDQDMTVLFSEGTRVYDPEGRLIDHDELERAEAVQVRGRLLRPRKWRANEDGDLVPTVRAKRIHVTAWVTGADSPDDDAKGADADDCHSDEAVYRRDQEHGPVC